MLQAPTRVEWEGLSSSTAHPLHPTLGDTLPPILAVSPARRTLEACAHWGAVSCQDYPACPAGPSLSSISAFLLRLPLFPASSLKLSWIPTVLETLLP